MGKARFSYTNNHSTAQLSPLKVAVWKQQQVKDIHSSCMAGWPAIASYDQLIDLLCVSCVLNIRAASS